MVRTSITHPLRIDDLTPGNGRLGITFCTCKKGASVFRATWDRDLDLDLDAVKGWGAKAVLSLIEDSEFEMLGVPELGEAVNARGIDWMHFLIRDLDTPTDGAMGRWAAILAQLHAKLERDGRVVVHCRGGLGGTAIRPAQQPTRPKAPHRTENACPAGRLRRASRQSVSHFETVG